MVRVLYFLFLFPLCLCSQAPVVFVESSDHLNISRKSGSLAKALVDLNGDFRDDLLTASGDSIQVEIQLNNGQLFKTAFKDKMTGDAYTLNVGDFNNDHFNDFLYSGFYKGIFSYTNANSISDFVLNQWLDVDLYAQGSSLFDVNNDGWLDAVMSHDDGASQIYINDTNGNLVLQEIIDFNTIPSSDNSGNYSAIWIDVNGDNRQDLFISKCKNGVDDPADPRRINALYINQDSGFHEAAAEFNLNHGEQTWCADSGDLDNDGDIDLVIINHNDPHMLLENIGNDSFVTHTNFADGGPLTTHDLEVVIQDFNNDGLLDILTSGVKNSLLLNKGELQFSRNKNPFGQKNASSAGVGDLNSDGYMDCYISFGGPGVPSTIQDETWINFGGSKNYLNLSLVGTMSNKSGIGAQICIYGPWGIQTRWLNSGTAYGLTNSLNIHFGLDQYESVDSLIVKWPSGVNDIFENLAANNHYVISEGNCIEPIYEIEHSALILDCIDDEIELTTGEGISNFKWNTNETAQTIIVDSIGYYYCRSLDDNCFNSSPILFIDTLRKPGRPDLNFTGEWQLCSGDQLELLTLNEIENLKWSDLSETNELLVVEDGLYFASNVNRCDTINSDSLSIYFSNNTYEDSLITIDVPGDVELNVVGDSIRWYADELTEILLGEGTPFLFENIVSDTSVYFVNTVERSYPSYIGGEQIDTTILEYGSEMTNGIMEFEVHVPTKINSIDVFAQTEGLRRILIVDGTDTIYSRDFNLKENLNKLELNFDLQAGFYTISTDSRVNIQLFSSPSPRLALIEQPDRLDYPYTITSLMEIESSSFGTSKYFYFYNWNIEPFYEECISNTAKFQIVLDTTVSNQNIVNNLSDIIIFPNPTNKIIMINGASEISEISLFGIDGKMLFSEIIYLSDADKTEIDLSKLPSGTYLLRLVTNEGLRFKKIIKL